MRYVILVGVVLLAAVTTTSNVETKQKVTCTAGGDLVTITFDSIEPSEAFKQMNRITKGIPSLEGTVVCH